MDETRAMLSFQRFEVYQHAVAFLSVAIQVIEELPPGQANIADQLRRAAQSVPLNIAEGAGRWSKPEMRKHYAIARGSAMEASAALDVLKVQDMIKPERYEEGMKRLESVVAILTKILTKEA